MKDYVLMAPKPEAVFFKLGLFQNHREENCVLQHAAMSLDLVRDIKKEEKLLAHIEDLVRSTGEAGDDLRNSPDSDDQVGKQVTVPLCTLTKSTQSNTNILLPGPLFSGALPR